MKKYCTPMLSAYESVKVVPAIAAVGAGIGLAEAAAAAATAAGFFGATRLVRALRGAEPNEKQPPYLKAVQE